MFTTIIQPTNLLIKVHNITETIIPVTNFMITIIIFLIIYVTIFLIHQHFVR